MSSAPKSWYDGSLLLLFVFVFFNNVALPHGLLYTTLLTPFFILWLARRKQYSYLGWFVGISTVLYFIHSGHDVEVPQYMKSVVLLLATYVFVVASYHFLKDNQRVGWYFKQILLFNTLLLPVAMLAFLHPVTREWFWYLVPFSPNVAPVPRLKMLTYEASYYSLMLAPIAFYYIAKNVFGRPKNGLVMLALAVLPLLISLSLGVLGSIAIALVGVILFNLKSMLQHKRMVLHLATGVGGLLLLLIVLTIVWPDNPIAERFANIADQRDTSARGRTYEAFWLAGKLLLETNIWVGAGPGQIKALGHDIFHEFYQIIILGPYTARIPNAAAETMAVYGVLGIAARLLFQLWLFIKFKVYRNLFSLGLFLFIFIYQFTGSYITSPLEYVIWILAVLPLFPEFHRTKLFSTS